MSNTASASIIVPAAPTKVWEAISNFTDASRQMIAVTDTQTEGGTRTVTFKNGHKVQERLVQSEPEKILRWSQETTQGFIPIKDVEESIMLAPTESDGTEVTFSFHYDTKMGPMGWLMNLMMVRGRLTGYAKANLKKIARKFSD